MPDITKINLDIAKTIDDLGDDKDIISEYIEKGKVNSFKKLKTFHRYPQHLYASPIFKDSEPFGVIVFDSLNKTDNFKNNIDNLFGYCRITESIINYIN